MPWNVRSGAHGSGGQSTRPLLLQNVTPFTADISMGTLEP